MKKEYAIEEIKEKINEDNFDCLEEKMEMLELLSDFESALEIRECSLCSNGKLLDDSTGEDYGDCGHCSGVGYKPIK